MLAKLGLELRLINLNMVQHCALKKDVYILSRVDLALEV